jgi:hypothetical protein
MLFFCVQYLNCMMINWISLRFVWFICEGFWHWYMAMDLFCWLVVQTEDIILEGEFNDWVLIFLTGPADLVPPHFPTQGQTDHIPQLLCPVQILDVDESHYLTVSLLFAHKMWDNYRIKSLTRNMKMSRINRIKTLVSWHHVVW